MLRHLTARSVRAFTLRLGGGPEVTVNADAEGILRAPPARRGHPIENGPLIEEAFPDVAEGLLSIYPGEIADERPKPVPEVEPKTATADTTTYPQPSTEAERVPDQAPVEPPTETKESEG